MESHCCGEDISSTTMDVLDFLPYNVYFQLKSKIDIIVILDNFNI